MAQRFGSRRSLLVLGLAAWLAMPACPVAVAEEAEPAKAEPAKSKEGDAAAQPQSRRWRPKERSEVEEAKAAMKRQVTKRPGRVLAKAREYLVEQKYDETEKVLKKLNLRRLNEYERALTYRTYAYVAYGRQDLAGSVDYLHKTLDEQSLPIEDSSDVLFQIAQIQTQQQKYAEAVETLKNWFEVVKEPGAAGYFALALAYFQMNDLDAAIEPAKKAIELAGNPQQGWLQLLLAIYLTKQDYNQATPVLVDLITRYPEVGKGYWLQLSSLYGVREDIDRALAVLQLAQRKGFLTDDKDLRRLVQLMQFKDVPVRAARTLEEGLEKKHVEQDWTAYELLGNSYIMARETKKAEAPLARAAELSPEGDLYVRLGQVLLLQEQWEGAAAALRHAVEKGGLDDPGSVQLLLGITYYNAENLAEARTWFTRARSSEKSRKSAESWLQHLDDEAQGPTQTGASSAGAETESGLASAR
jgi:tetratricopeptide (TPR) repeat protein